MPYSHDAPKMWALDRIEELAWAHTAGRLDILDVGPGAGTWGRLIQERAGHFELPPVLDCIEAHGPYVERFDLGAIYSNIIVGDVRQWDWGGCNYVTVAESPDPIGPGIPKWTWDLVILGDVLEHMTHDEARAVVERALVHADAVLVVVPLGEWPQGESEGNPLEAHVSTWTGADLDTLPKCKRAEITILPDAENVEERSRIAALCLGTWP